MTQTGQNNFLILQQFKKILLNITCKYKLEKLIILLIYKKMIMTTLKHLIIQ